ncbi:hypothetical protein DZD52_04230 [Xanthomonas nasturtii]|uniref:Uncharacterized protein n=1 Tax=Xanthomonas nasturtii TaxID=1843581 RepID=A0A3E1KQR5_9XANT|nr:hypothetical protein DZD52_04230 [Xanthomonas nasturtii]
MPQWPAATRPGKRTLTPTPAARSGPRPGPRQQRGRSKTLPSMACKQCLLVQQGRTCTSRCRPPQARPRKPTLPFSRREKVPRRGG